MKGLGSYQTEHQSLRTHTSVAEHILRVTKGSNFHKQLSAEQGTRAWPRLVVPPGL
jgi:hypothetical protein